MAFEIDIGYTSLAGKKTVNEDFCAAMLPEPGREAHGAIFAMADGVSTGGGGREAAQTTVMSLVRDYFGTPQTWDTTVALDRVIGAQNSWLAGINKRRKTQSGLTTLTALVLRGQGYTVAHVGDTRAYLVRSGVCSQITTDHVHEHPDMRHQLLRCIGADERLHLDFIQGDMLVGDVFVLLSDGVYGAVPDKHYVSYMQQDTAQSMSDAMVQAALELGSQDNASALVVRVLGVLQSSLQDENRHSKALPTLQRMKVGEAIDGLVVTSLVADTGVNLLYQVRDPVSKKLYALKTLHPAREHDAQEGAMLAHEAWLAKRVQSSRAAQHLVRLHDSLPNAQSPSHFYLLYDWHGGETLQQKLDRRDNFGTAQAIAAATHALRGLGLLHRQGVVHRDIKPSNLHLGSDGVLRILDLGVAISGNEPASTRELHAGTPSYINPEQFGFSLRGDTDEQTANAQSDLYALGVTLYQLLTGKLPYGEVLPYQTGRYFRDATAPSRINPVVPIWLDNIVLKAVARDQRQRFETAEEFLLALERGASRPLSAPMATPLLQLDPSAMWKVALAVSMLFNLLLVLWLLFLPK